MSQSYMFSPLELEKAASLWLGFESEFDVAAVTAGTNPVRGVLFAYGPVVVAGYPLVEAVCSIMQCEVLWSFPEGTFVDATRENKITIGSIKGPACRLSQLERTCSEILSRCSACATYARRCVDNAKAANPKWKGVVCATRKTTPGSWGRLVEKYGAFVGGAYPHRYDLSTLVYLDDGHIDMCDGSVSVAVAKARTLCGFSYKIEIECRSLQDALEACRAGADMVMLDHFKPDLLLEVAAQVKKEFPYVVIETGGRITAETVGNYTFPCIDVISMSAITRSPEPAKIHMKLDVSYVPLGPKL